MGEIKRKYKRTRIDTSKNQLLDTETGEVIEIKNASLYKTVPTNEVSIDYRNYVYLDTDKIPILLTKGVKQVELGLLLTLACNIQNRFCVCLKDGDEPHSTKSIAEMVGETPQSVKAKLNNLVEMGVLAYDLSKGNESWGKVYILNPHVIKKGIKLSQSVCEIFDDITEEA